MLQMTCFNVSWNKLIRLKTRAIYKKKKKKKKKKVNNTEIKTYYKYY